VADRGSTVAGRKEKPLPEESQIREAQAQRLRFLNAIYDREQSGEQYPDTTDVAWDIGLDPDNWEPIQRITEALKADQLISGAETDIGLLTAALTGPGRRLVETKSMGHEPTGGSPASIGDVRNDGSGNVIQISQYSPGAQQAEISPFDKRAMLRWADDVEGAHPATDCRPRTWRKLASSWRSCARS
jgi:hypothetical protein